MIKRLSINALLFLVYCTPLPAQTVTQPKRMENMSYIQNDLIKVGIDLNMGGAITYVADKSNGVNFINNWDLGRQVQMSFYSGPVPFEPDGKKAHKAWTFIGWNPIQSGDVAGNKSKVLEHKNTGKALYVKCIPMHWPLDNVPGECTYECWITLDGKAIKVTSRIVNNRPDATQYPARGQELPAVYTNAPWHRLITYRGTKPFTNDTLSLIPNHNIPGSPNIQWAQWQATESWAANVDENNNGLGIWNDGVQSFSGGYYGDSSFKGGSGNEGTGYIAPNSVDVLDHNITYDYHYTLIVGNVKNIRDYVYSHHRATTPVYNFKNSRLQWYYVNTTDKGWPINKGLRIALKKDAAMISPATFWQAEALPNLVFEAAYPAHVKKARIYWRGFNGNFDETKSILINIIPDGKQHRYRIPLQQSPAYKGTLNGLKILLDTNGTAKDGETVKVVYIALEK
jgi:hypothetical protein